MVRLGYRQVSPRHTANNSIGRPATIELPCPARRTLLDRQNRNMYRGAPCPSLGEKQDSGIGPRFRLPARAEANPEHSPPAFRRGDYAVHRPVRESRVASLRWNCVHRRRRQDGALAAPMIHAGKRYCWPGTRGYFDLLDAVQDLHTGCPRRRGIRCTSWGDRCRKKPGMSGGSFVKSSARCSATSGDQFSS